MAANRQIGALEEGQAGKMRRRCYSVCEAMVRYSLGLCFLVLRFMPSQMAAETSVRVAEEGVGRRYLWL